MRISVERLKKIIRKYQTETVDWKNKITELKKKKINRGVQQRFNWVEESSKIEDRVVELIQAEAQKRKKRMKKSEHSLMKLWDTIKWTNICIIVVPEGQHREKGADSLFRKIMAKNFPNLRREWSEDRHFDPGTSETSKKRWIQIEPHWEML